MNCTFSIEYATIWGESLTLVGADAKYPMQWSPNNIWKVTVNDCDDSLFSDYSYVLVRDGIIIRTEWEHHKSFPTEEITDHWIDCPLPGCRFARKHSASIFDRIGFRGAGTAVALFSLRSDDDFGIGDFRDLHLLTNWAAGTGQCIIQLLPINDTTRNGGWEESFPYNPVSSFALNPLYIRLQDLGIEQDAAFCKKQEELNSLPEIDYPLVHEAKMAYLRMAFEERGARDMASEEYGTFCKRNSFWLKEYSSFCAMRDKGGIEFYEWVQYHLDRQLSQEVEYAHSKGICLKGDLPIGVGRDSADCRFHPNLFNLDSNAGAPPDAFSESGQNWGFPTYNWEEMEREDYRWWKARLRKMAEYFDAFRIDHILGFFRIWEIPSDRESGLEGHFNPALPYSSEEIETAGLPIDGLFREDPRQPGMYQPCFRPQEEHLPERLKDKFTEIHTDFFYHRNEAFWKRNALRKLPELLNATGMLACGEDLGMVPDCVTQVMEELGILSLRVRGMERPGPLREMSVCTTSSHDMETLRMQCENDPSPLECRDMLREYLASPSMLAIFPIQDWLSLDETVRRQDRNSERINNPASTSRQWRYRIHFPMEKLMEDGCRELNSTILKMLREGSRL